MNREQRVAVVDPFGEHHPGQVIDARMGDHQIEVRLRLDDPLVAADPWYPLSSVATDDVPESLEPVSTRYIASRRPPADDTEPKAFSTVHEAWGYLHACRQREEDTAGYDGVYDPIVDDLATLSESMYWQGLGSEHVDWLDVRGLRPDGTGTLRADTPGHDPASGDHDSGVTYSVHSG